MITSRDQFEQYILQALKQIPEKIRRRMDNVAVVVEDDIRAAKRGEMPILRGGELLGLYQGIPLTRRGEGYNMVPPDKITLFQGAIERVAGANPIDIEHQAMKTLWHEVAHHLGMNEAEVRAWERRRASS